MSNAPDNRRLLALERGTVFKPAAKIKAVLCYPNTYHLGMSSLGFQTIYKELNAREETYCERAFLPERSALRSLETDSALNEFDVVGFSISFELDYINFIKMMRDAKIPLRRKERGAMHPLVIAGGIITSFNFSPLEDFVDIFLLGEADELIHKAFDIISSHMDNGREEILKELSGLSSVYVPQFPKERAPARIEALDKFETATCILTPETEFPDTYLIETSRGCARDCNFCVTAYSCGSFRIRGPDKILETARRGLKLTKRLGLVGAAVSDYPRIDELCERLLAEGAKVSFSSLRADRITPAIIGALVKSGQRSLTIAPEAGDERLRALIKKGVSDEDIFDAVSAARAGGIREVRLYFMLGLPTETQSDIEAVVKLVKELSRILPVKVKLTPFVPKPKTPFERYDIEPQNILKDKIRYITARLAPLKRIKISHESVRLSRIEARLAKGGPGALDSFIDT